MYKRKTKDYYEIELYTNYGWETVTAEETWKDAKRSLREYRENVPGSYRATKKRERI